MAKIAFCDDDVSVLAEMQRLMEQYCAERDCKIEYNVFNHPFDLVAEIEKGNSFLGMHGFTLADTKHIIFQQGR